MKPILNKSRARRVSDTQINKAMNLKLFLDVGVEMVQGILEGWDPIIEQVVVICRMTDPEKYNWKGRGHWGLSESRLTSVVVYVPGKRRRRLRASV